MPSGVKIGEDVVEGKKYELWRTNCNKKGCTKCPHGPYWFQVSWDSGRKRLLYRGINLPKAGDPALPVGPADKPPWKCDCGGKLGDAERLRRRCSKCRAELTSQGYIVRCPDCGNPLNCNRLDSDYCSGCGSYNLPVADYELRLLHSPRARPNLEGRKRRSD